MTVDSYAYGTGNLYEGLGFSSTKRAKRRGTYEGVGACTGGTPGPPLFSRRSHIMLGVGKSGYLKEFQRVQNEGEDLAPTVSGEEVSGECW